MSAATAARNTPTMGNAGKRFAYPVAASTTIWQGTLCCLDTSGNVIAGATNTTSGTGFLALETYVNVATVSSTTTMNVGEAVAQFVNGNSITKASIGSVCYYVDNQTVTTSTTGTSICGIIDQVDSNGVWVQLSQPSVAAY